MNTKAVNISFQKTLLSAIDRAARKESRSRSELVREAVRLYIAKQDRWNRIFALTKKRTARAALSESDVLDEIQAYRSRRSH